MTGKILSSISIGLSLLVALAAPALSTESLRTLSFPPISLGNLIAPQSGQNLIDRKFHALALGKAQGKLQTKATDVVLVANYSIVQEPALLKQVSDGTLAGLHIDDLDATDETLKALSHLKSLRRLQITQTEITDRGIAYLKPLTKLEALVISNCNIKGSTIFDLPLTQLTMLQLSYMEIDLPAFTKISRFSKLKVLDFSRARLDDRALVSLGKLPQLQSLDLASNHLITNRGIACLAGLKHLEYLDLRKSKVNIAGLRQLSGLPLKTLIPPDRLTVREVKELQTLFPACKIKMRYSASDSDYKLFAPLH